MKNILVGIFIMFTGVLMGQAETGLLKGIKTLDRERYKKEDTIPTVIYIKDKLIKNEPIVYINGDAYGYNIIGSLNSELIDSIKVEKETRYDDDERYFGSLYITYKNEYQPQLIPLNQLKSKYLKEIATPILFFLNEKPIEEDYDKYMVDEKYIMKIEVDEIVNNNEDLNLTLVKLITRTEKNRKKANTIYIRGDNVNE